MEERRELITVKQAAEILNRSVSGIYKALHSNRLRYADEFHRLLDRKGLEERFARATRPRIDYPAPTPATKAEEEEITFEDRWAAIADGANQILDPEAWGQPPWTAHQWGVLAGALDIAIQDNGEKKCIQN